MNVMGDGFSAQGKGGGCGGWRVTDPRLSIFKMYKIDSRIKCFEYCEIITIKQYLWKYRIYIRSKI